MADRSPILTDDELAEICRPLTQSAARIRFLRGLGVTVERRPDGTPLVKRADWERQGLGQAPQPNDRAAGAQPRWSRAA